MKNLTLLFAVLIVMGSCHNYKKDAQNLLVVKDSLLVETEIKDSSILNFLNGYNEIQANLDSIKKIEEMVTIQSTQGQELSAGQKMLILEDIQLINNLLQKNKEQISSLQSKYKNSNFKVGKLEKMVAEFEIMLESIKVQNQEKDTEIYTLKNEVQNLNLNIGQLSEKISSIESDIREKEQTIESQINEMNLVHFAIGSARELKEVGILQKTGGFLGIGRTPTIESDFNREYFTPVDIREFDFIPLMTKKAKLLSVHSAASFHISGEKTADTLFIDNKSEFWKATKFLLILAE